MIKPKVFDGGCESRGIGLVNRLVVDTHPIATNAEIGSTTATAFEAMSLAFVPIKTAMHTR